MLTDVAQFADLRDKIHNYVNGSKRGKQKSATLETVQSRYVAHVRAIINKLTTEDLKIVGITPAERKTLTASMTNFIEKIAKDTENARKNNKFTEWENDTIGHWVSEFKKIVDIVKKYYEAVEPLYDQMNPHKHRSTIKGEIRLVLYVLEPNVRSAWYGLTPEGASNEDNIIYFGINNRVVVVFNRMKRDWQTPLISDLHEYTAVILWKYYQTFYKKGNYYPLFRNDNDGFWIAQSWTNRVTADFKTLFDGKLSVRTMRVWEINVCSRRTEWGEIDGKSKASTCYSTWSKIHSSTV